MAKRYKCFLNSGIKFLFAYDETDPTLLHIYARHLTSPDIAMQVWWEGDKEVWNIEHSRYETTLGEFTIYWFWLKNNTEVLIITCFKG